jgi:AbrB family looped-hinge helix DNA binding protein
MDMVKLGKKGQVSIPKSILRRLGLEGETPLLVDVTADGAIVLRPAVVYPVEIYDDERLREFAEADLMDPAVARRVSASLAKSR